MWRGLKGRERVFIRARPLLCASVLFGGRHEFDISAGGVVGLELEVILCQLKKWF
jgi:hypothetical protein